jgi:hypothetical protein
MELPDTARWALTHGLIRLVLRRETKRGNTNALFLTDPAVRDEPYPHYDSLRGAGPFSPGLAGKITVRHPVATEVLRSEHLGTASHGGAPGPARRLLSMGTAGRSVIEPPSMLVVDGPDHTRYRRLVTRAFTAKAVAALRARTEEVAEQLLDDLARDQGGGPVDLVRRYASQLPVIMICEILGAPVSMREQFLTWGDAAATSLDPGMPLAQFKHAQRGIDALLAWMREHFETLRREPGQDVLSHLVAQADSTADAVDRLTEPELLATSLLVLAAGFETTVNLIGTGIQLLADHPDQLDVLHADPTRWPNAVDEVLRYDSPVQRTARRAERDTEVAGVPLRAGEIVIVLLAAANRDPEVFDDPARFDVTRPNASKHLSFSSGPHHCVGAQLARMEGEVALRALTRRFPELTMLGRPHRRPTSNLRGYDSLVADLGTRAGVS